MHRSWRSIAIAATLATASVAFPSAQRSIPSPAAVIGWEPCADYKLATYEQIEDYVRRLAAAAPDRMRLVDMGKTTEGRTQVLGGHVVGREHAPARPISRTIARRLALWRATARAR